MMLPAWKLARLEARAVHRMSDMSQEQLAARIDQLIRLHPDVEELAPALRNIFASMTDRQIVAYALLKGGSAEAMPSLLL
jgi:hypothetical protein